MGPSAAAQSLGRQSITYHASIWGDYFLSYASVLEKFSSRENEEHRKLKDEVRKLLAATPNDSLQKLELIDAAQRLGVGYHFEKESDESLKNIYDAYLEGNIKDENDLYVAALRFRLLRQHGYKMSSDVFNTFVNREGKIEESLANNVRGILGLYEASQYGTHGEDILVVALEFSSSHLKSKLSQISNASLNAQVKEAMETPIHKNLIRLHTTKFIPMYQEDELHNEELLTFAKLDFNFIQKLHQKELSDITRWWKALDFCNKLPFARDRMVECYFWILGIYFEPQFRIGRIILSKVLMLASVIDDIYEVRGTMDELKLFTDAIRRWDMSAMEQLSPYMRPCYEALLNVYEEIKELEKPEDCMYRTSAAKKEMQKLVEAYFEEAKRLSNKQIPTLDEYMEVGLPSSGYMMVALTSLVGMGDLVVKQDCDWAASEPLIVRASALIARLMDDMAGYEFETKLAAAQCYMNEKGATKEEAFVHLGKKVCMAWKDINQECLHPTAVSMPILTRIVNSARVIHLIYKDGDGYTNSKTRMKDAIKSVLIQPMTI